jgi:hypothetical protein
MEGTQTKHGMHILDGGFGSGQFKDVAPHQNKHKHKKKCMGGTQGSHQRHMRQTFGMDGGKGKHMAGNGKNTKQKQKGLHTLDGGFGSGQFKNAERKILDATLVAASAQDNPRDASRPLGE